MPEFFFGGGVIELFKMRISLEYVTFLPGDCQGKTYRLLYILLYEVLGRQVLQILYTCDNIKYYIFFLHPFVVDTKPFVKQLSVVSWEITQPWHWGKIDG